VVGDEAWRVSIIVFTKRNSCTILPHYIIMSLRRQRLCI
jgi:hypothetical protein